MSYTVYIAPAAQRQFKKLSRAVQQRLAKRLRKLEDDPRSRGVAKLSDSENLYRIAVGDHRIIYQVQDPILRVLVVKVAPRKGVYRRILQTRIEDVGSTRLAQLLERLGLGES